MDQREQPDCSAAAAGVVTLCEGRNENDSHQLSEGVGTVTKLL